jgi:hypothetical protein
MRKIIKKKYWNMLLMRQFLKGILTLLKQLSTENPLPEKAINDIIIGKDYFLKVNIDNKKISDTGLLIYAKNGCNAWASKFAEMVYENNYCHLGIKKKYGVIKKWNPAKIAKKRMHLLPFFYIFKL